MWILGNGEKMKKMKKKNEEEVRGFGNQSH